MEPKHFIEKSQEKKVTYAFTSGELKLACNNFKNSENKHIGPNNDPAMIFY